MWIVQTFGPPHRTRDLCTVVAYTTTAPPRNINIRNLARQHECAPTNLISFEISINTCSYHSSAHTDFSNGRTMNSLILVCVVIFAIGANGHTVHLSDTQKETANKYVAECVKETGIKPEVIAEAKKGQFSDDEGLKKFTLCFFEKAGIVDHEGKLNVATALSKLPAGVDKAEAEKVLESCKNKTGKDAAEKAFEILKCYRQGAKNHIFLGF